MSDAKTSEGVSTKRLKVAERAKREPEARMLALAHHLDEELMAAAYRRIRKDAAVGVDGVTKEQYGAPGGQSPDAAHANAGGAISPSTHPTGAHPEGTWENAPDRHLDH